MTIQDIANLSDIDEKIKKLSVNGLKDEFIEECKKALDPQQHDVFDVTKRPKREKKIKRTINGVVQETTEYVDVNRIAVPLQHTIIERAVAFLFGNPVQISCSGDSKYRDEIANAFKLIGEDNKIDAINSEIATIVESCTMAAEYWYKVDTPEKENRYGFESKGKLRCQIFNPLKGDKLYPYFDERGDLIAFSRGFTITEDDEDVEYFETWIDNNGKISHERYKKGENGWVEAGKKEDIVIGKIPIAFASQPHVAYYFVQSIINRYETILSNNGDINDRHAWPILAAWGNVKSDLGDFIQLTDTEHQKADIKYVERMGNADAINRELDRMEAMAFKFTQTPDISFEKMVGQVAEGTMDKMFVDAHMAAKNRFMRVYDAYLTRRYNILKEFLGVMNPVWKNDLNKVKVNIKVTPYMVGNDKETLASLIEAHAAGGLSTETFVEQNPLVENPKQELERLNAEKLAKEAEKKEKDNIFKIA